VQQVAGIKSHILSFDRIRKGTQQYLFLISGIFLPTFIEMVMSSITVLVVCGPIYFFNLLGSLSVYFYITKRISSERKVHLETQVALDKQATFLISETLNNYYNINIFHNKEYEFAKYSTLMDRRVASAYESQNLLFKLNIAQKAVIVAGTFINILICIHGIKSGQLSAGDIILINNISLQVFAPLFNLGMMYTRWQESFVEINELMQLMALKNEIVEAPNAQALQFKEGTIDIEKVDLSFGMYQSVG
jgi:ATP-binding cassette subfamily B protein